MPVGTPSTVPPAPAAPAADPPVALRLMEVTPLNVPGGTVAGFTTVAAELPLVTNAVCPALITTVPALLVIVIEPEMTWK